MKRQEDEAAGHARTVILADTRRLRAPRVITRVCSSSMGCPCCIP
jgi:hypothetical protein